MPLDGLFLDMYGTLTGGDRAAVEATCAAVICDTGLTLTPGDLAVTWGERFFADLEQARGERFLTLRALEEQSLVRTLAALGHAVDPRGYVQRLVDYWCAPPLQPEVPAFLAACPVPICIVSNADKADLAAAIAHHGLGVAAAVTSEEAGAYKPAPAIFELALARTGWRRDRVLHVGDSLHSDVGGARAAGLRSVWVNRAHRIHDIGTDAPDYEVGDLLELLPLLARVG